MQAKSNALVQTLAEPASAGGGVLGVLRFVPHLLSVSHSQARVS
jgi:hypothetical protein